MSEQNKFITTKEFREITGESEITQYRNRFPKGPLEFYRLAGRIVYTKEQVERYLETKRVGPKRHALAPAA